MPPLGYIALRLVKVAVTLLLLITLVYGAMYLAPGDAASLVAGPGATREVLEATRKMYGLDQPMHTQYLRFLSMLAQGDFGISWRTGRAVRVEMDAAIPHTLLLATTALLIALGFGITAGVLAAVHHKGRLDKLSTAAALLGLSTPIFVLNLAAIYIFAYRLGWFPTSGAMSSVSIVLPATSLGIFVATVIARMVRSVMLEVLRQEFIRTARAKGLPEWMVVYKHGLRNAAIPIVTIVGMQFGLLLGGSVITETVFAWPGLGHMIITAIKFRDTPVAQGGVIFFAGSFMLINLAVDLAYQYIDPRLRIK